MSIASGTSRPTINWLPLLSLWEKDLVNGRECKMAAKNDVDSIFNIDQTNVLFHSLTQKLRENIKQYVQFLFCTLH